MVNADYKSFEDERWTKREQAVVFRHQAACAFLKDCNAENYLDIGCGDATFEFYCAEKTSITEVTGIDLSPVAVETAEKKFPEGRFIVADVLATGIPLTDKSYDAVVALDVLEHTFTPDRLLGEMSRVSNKYLIIGVPNFSSFPARIQMLFGKVPENNRPKKGHVYWFNRNVLVTLLQSHGLLIKGIKTNFQGADVPVLGRLIKLLTFLFPSLFALSFVVLAEKKS